METTTITCPKCGTNVPLTAALEQTLTTRIKTQLEAEVAKKDSELRKREETLKTAQQNLEQEVDQRLAEEKRKLTAEEQKKAKEAVAVQMTALQAELSEKKQKLKEAQQQELQLVRDREKLREAQESFELEKAKQIEAEREKIRKEAETKASQASAKQLEELRTDLATKDQFLREAQEAELALRKERTKFEEEKKAFDLELARRLDVAKEEVKKEKDEEHRLREAESNKKLEAMKAQIDELKRKAEQGSQQVQGEVLEIDIESALRRCFGDDEIVPVPKGEHGGDILQHVRNELHQPCGTVIWESKRTKNWSDNWIGKLKEDALAAKAQIAVIVSETMPKDVPSFECRENVWITPPYLAMPLAAALRLTILETATARRASEGRHDKMELVYDYLSGLEFKARVTAIVEAFSEMQDELNAEKRATLKIWAKREKLIERVMQNTVGMYGDIAGIVGGALPAIDKLERPALADDSQDGDDRASTTVAKKRKQLS